MEEESKKLFIPKSSKKVQALKKRNCFQRSLNPRIFRHEEAYIDSRIYHKVFMKDDMEKFFETLIKKIVNFNEFGGETHIGAFFRIPDSKPLDFLDGLYHECFKLIYSEFFCGKERLERLILNNNIYKILEESTLSDLNKFLSFHRFFNDFKRLVLHEKINLEEGFDFQNNDLNNLDYNIEKELDSFIQDFKTTFSRLVNSEMKYLEEEIEFQILDIFLHYLINIKQNFVNSFLAFLLIHYQNGVKGKTCLTKIFQEALRIKIEMDDFVKSSKLIEKITGFLEILQLTFDSETQKSIFFTSNQNYLWFNPCYLGLFFFYEMLMKEKKIDGEPSYNEFSLPKITFLNFNGYSNILEESLITRFSKVQYISIIFEDLKINDIACTTNKSKQNFAIKISKKLKINSYDIFFIFESIIFKLISKFEPSLIIFSHSFIFNSNIIENIDLKPFIFKEIIEKLMFFSNHKFILCPIIKKRENDSSPFLINLKKKSQIARNYDEFQNLFSFTEQELKNFKPYIHEMIGSFFVDSPCSSYKVKSLKKKTNLHFQKLLIKAIDEFCSENPSFAFLLPKTIHIRILHNLKIKILNTPQRKDEKVEKNKKMMEKEQPYLTNKFYLIKLNKKEKTLTSVELILKESEENSFYYDLKSTLSYICYDIGKVFFFNVRKNGFFQNYSYDFFAESKTYVKKIPHYLPNQENRKLIDCSIVYQKLKSIYLIWGRFVGFYSKEEFFNAEENPEKNIDLNFLIRKFDINREKWSDIKIQNFCSPRIKASAVLFENEKDETVIFLFGGAKYNDSFDGKEIMNIVNKITISGNDNCINIPLEKSKYKNEYIPLYNSLVINVAYNEMTNNYSMLMLGGEFDQYIYNQKQNKLIYFEINYNGNTGDCKFDYNEIINFDFKNYLSSISFLNKNFIYIPENKRLILNIICLQKTNRKDLDEISNLKNFTKTFRLHCETSFLKSESITEIKHFLLDIPFSKLNLNNISINQIANKYIIKDNQLFFPNCFDESNKTIDLYLKKDQNAFHYFEIEKKTSLNCIKINTIKYSIESDDFSNFILGSKINFNSCIFSNDSREIFFLKENLDSLSIMKISLWDLKLKYLEPSYVLNENTSFSKKKSIFFSHKKVFIVGGVKCEEKEAKNFFFQTLSKEVFYFPSNKKDMAYPYVFELIDENFLFLINRKIIYESEDPYQGSIYLECINMKELKIWYSTAILINEEKEKKESILINEQKKEKIIYSNKLKNWIQKSKLAVIFSLEILAVQKKQFFLLNFEDVLDNILNKNENKALKTIDEISLMNKKKFLTKIRKENEDFDYLFLDQEAKIYNVDL